MLQAHTLSSPRLWLLSLTAPAIEALLADNSSDLQHLVAMAVPPDWPGEAPADRRMLEMRLEQLRAQPGIEMWLIRALVDAYGEMIGHAGFHYPPVGVDEALGDPTYRGERTEAQGGLTEIGCTIFPAYRSQGLATEAVGVLIKWALETMHVGGIIASTAPDNLSSIRVLERVGGFRQIGRCLDEHGHQELVFRRDR